MRIIGGTYKSRKIEMVTSTVTRSTMDKVREAIFNIISPYGVGDTILDLFAGSGAFALEALSRGATKAYFVDVNLEPIKTIKKNIEILSLQKFSFVYKMDYWNALKLFKEKNIKFDTIFLDPPYKLEIIKEIIDYIIKENLLNNGGLIITEYDQPFTFDFDLEIIKDKIYGIRKVTVFRRNNDE